MMSMTKDGRSCTYDFGLEEGVVEVVEVHVDMIRRDQDGQDAKGERYVILVVYGGFDAVLVAVGETIGRRVDFSTRFHHVHSNN